MPQIRWTLGENVGNNQKHILAPAMETIGRLQTIRDVIMHKLKLLEFYFNFL